MSGKPRRHGSHVIASLDALLARILTVARLKASMSSAIMVTSLMWNLAVFCQTDRRLRIEVFNYPLQPQSRRARQEDGLYHLGDSQAQPSSKKHDTDPKERVSTKGLESPLRLGP